MKILSYFFSSLFAIVFYTLLLVFHPLQWIGLNLFGYKGHKFVVDYMNWFLIKSLLFVGIRVSLDQQHELPKNTSFIFVSNHQSMFDIPPIIWFFKKYHPKFVSKKELGKGIPSISYNLRNGGAALIDRKDPKQSLSTLARFAKNIHKNNWSAVIFPEGTRSKNGKLKKFSPNGIKILAKYNPDAFIVPLTINNSWKVFKYGKFPVGLGSPIKIKMHAPIKISEMPFENLLEKVHAAIQNDII